MKNKNSNKLTKKELKQCKKEIKKQLSATRKHAEFSIDKSAYTTYNEWAVSQHLREMAEAVWKNNLLAQKRIRFGLYEKCSKCQQEIGKNRLLVNPAAVRCLICQKEHEQQKNIH